MTDLWWPPGGWSKHCACPSHPLRHAVSLDAVPLNTCFLNALENNR
jgi:hypothetical protein